MVCRMACLLVAFLVAGCGSRPAQPGGAAKAGGGANVQILAFTTPRRFECQTMENVLKAYEKDTGRTVRRVNVDEEPELARQYEVTVLPTVIVVGEDEVMVNKVIGLVPIQTLKGRLARSFGDAADPAAR